jgi:GNAT superfamily N-acetyltransferase
MQAQIEIGYLADHQNLVTELAAAFIKEWPAYYSPGGRGDALGDLRSRNRRNRLPLALVALNDGRLHGTVTLQGTTESHAHLSPWLTALLVLPAYRRQGIGTRLIRAAEHLASVLKFENLYTRTGTAVPLFTRLGWTAFDTAVSGKESLTVFRKKLCNGQERQQWQKLN